ncbi:dipeptide epimerase [Micrococcus sp. 2A]|uniref:dipeptide epimerase n=1 Tax=Micrococcus TaxID=1269 RepID=UPI0031BA6AB1
MAHDDAARTSPVTVASVRAHLHASRLLRPFVTAQRRTEAVAYVAVDVTLAGGPGEVAGVVGQGSAAETVAVTGESAETILAAVNGPIRAALEGVSGTPDELAALARGVVPGASSARAAVDVAVHDALARALGVPLVELLGAPCGVRLDPAAGIASDMTVSLEEPAVMAGHAREAAADGYGILKIKLGRDAEQDRERLAAVVEAAPGARLRIDANQGWTPDEAVRVLARFAADGLPIDLVEQPVARDDLAGLARVRAESPFPVMADEAVWGPDDARRIIDAGAADMLNIKLAKTGGLGEALAVADLAAEAGLTCMVGAMMEPRIGIAAGAHLAFAHPAIAMVDLDPPAWFASPLPAGGFTDDGTLRLTGGPGLGLERLCAEDDPPTM